MRLIAQLSLLVVLCVVETQAWVSYRVYMTFLCNKKEVVNPANKKATASLWFGDDVTYNKMTRPTDKDALALFDKRKGMFKVEQKVWKGHAMAHLEGYGGYDTGLMKYGWVRIEDAECNGKKITGKNQWFYIQYNMCRHHGGNGGHFLYECVMYGDLKDHSSHWYG